MTKSWNFDLAVFIDDERDPKLGVELRALRDARLRSRGLSAPWGGTPLQPGRCSAAATRSPNTAWHRGHPTGRAALGVAAGRDKYTWYGQYGGGG